MSKCEIEWRHKKFRESRDTHSQIDMEYSLSVEFSFFRQRNRLMTRAGKALISLADTPYYHILT